MVFEAFIFVNGEELEIADLPHVKWDCSEEKGWGFYLQGSCCGSPADLKLCVKSVHEKPRLGFEGAVGALLKQKKPLGPNVEYVLYQLVLLLCDSSSLTISGVLK